ncbi:MAG: galactose-1-phosphate uridylyltransferase [bacterium]
MMPEMRRNPITKSWTIIATERAKRPERPLIDNKLTDEKIIEEITYEKKCFFCLGNEHTTPPEVFAYRDNHTLPNTPGWSLRVVPNKFAALNLEQEFHVKQENSLKVSSHAAGVAEVVIESPHHSKNLALFQPTQVEDVLKAYKERFLSISQKKTIKYILLFKNNGVEAGASLAHPHSQIIATPVIPVNISEELIGANDYFESTGRCVYCDMMKMEIKDKSRIIYESENFVSFAPYASRTPFETWIMPKFHSSKFQDLDDMQIQDLAKIWKHTLYKIYVGLENPPYNYFIHTSPTQKNTDKYYHWHMELIPKLTIAAGFELGTGIYINIAIPEDCAEFLREF